MPSRFPTGVGVGTVSGMRASADTLNHAVVLRRELLAQGITDNDIRTLVRRGELHRVRHGSYVPKSLWDACGPEDRHRLRVRAVLKRAHPCTVATHTSSAIERGASAWGVSLDEVHVTRADGHAGRHEAGVVHHSGVLPEEEIEVVNGVRLSTAPRAAVEVTTLYGVEEALVLVNGLLSCGALDKRQLSESAADRRHWPNSLTTTLVERLCDSRLTSVAESRTWYLLWTQHLPRPEPQVPVHDEHGMVVAYADFGWREFGVFLEFDGRLKYEVHRREGETLEQYLMREKRREELICLLTGWTCIRIQWRDLAYPERTAGRIRRVLESRRRPLPA